MTFSLMGKDNPAYYKKSRKKLYGIIAGIIVILAIGFWAIQDSEDDALTLITEFDPAILQEDAPAVKGDPNAPITVIEYADFECPFCGRFYQQTLPQIERNYVDEGLVKIEFRHFPIVNAHPHAYSAAHAAECAREQGTDNFWAMHNKLFEGQTRLSESNYRSWANEIGLDMGAFNTCMNEDKYREQIEADAAQAAADGFTGTPAFLVNGQAVTGAQPYQTFDQVFQSILSRPGAISAPSFE